MATLTVGTANAAPGSVAKGHMFVANHPGGEPYRWHPTGDIQRVGDSDQYPSNGKGLPKHQGAL